MTEKEWDMSSVLISEEEQFALECLTKSILKVMNSPPRTSSSVGITCLLRILVSRLLQKKVCEDDALYLVHTMYELMKPLAYRQEDESEK